MLQNVKSAAYKHRPTCSGAVINLKVQVAHVWRKALGNFLGFKSTISRFGERFRDGQYSLVSFLFAVLLLTVFPRAQPFVNEGRGHVPPSPMESAPLEGYRFFGICHAF